MSSIAPQCYDCSCYMKAHHGYLGQPSPSPRAHMCYQFRSMLFPVLQHGPRLIQVMGDTPSPYQGEILTPLAPFYLQAKQSKAMKWFPLQAAIPNTAVESPKTKCSGGKGRHHHSLGHGSNTSTPKHPDSASAKKPSSSKEPVLKEQDKSPRSHGSHKHSHSPSLSAKSKGHKQKEAHTEDTHKLNSTFPISSSGFDGFHSPMGSISEEPNSILPPSPQPPLGLGTP